MTTHSVDQFFTGLWTPELLPFLLAFATACLTLRYDRREADTPAKRRKAFTMFLVGGILGTLLSIFLFGQKQLEVAEATTKAKSEALRADQMRQELTNANYKLDAATNQLADMATQFTDSTAENRKLQSQILKTQEDTARTLTQISDWLALIQAQTNAPVTMVSETLQVFEQLTVDLTKSTDPEISQRARETLNMISNVRNGLAVGKPPMRPAPPESPVEPAPNPSPTNSPLAPPSNLHFLPGS